jgi:hypothetical protein
MATTTLIPFFRQQFFDSSGNALAAGTITFYAAGTTTLQDTYSDSAGQTANANPVQLDAAGVPSSGQIYLASNLSYKAVVKTSAGATVQTIDNIGAIPPTSINLDITGTAGENLTAGNVVYLSDGSGGTTAGRWYKADADQTYSSSLAGMVGMVPDNITSAATGTIRLSGRMSGLSGLTAGAAYYVSGTGGALTLTAPTNVRFVGTADSTTAIVIAANQQQLATNGALHSLIRFDGTATASEPAVSAAGDAATYFNSSENEWRLSVNGGAYLVVPTVNPATCDGRLTLESGVAVSTSDQTAKTSVYFTPFRGNRVSLYDGTRWRSYTFTERTLALGTLTSDLPYDVYLHDNAGTLTLEATAWTNTTTRATALTTQDGIFVKTGSTTRRYLGTFVTTATTTTEDSAQQRFLYNYYHPVSRPLAWLPTDNTWTYDSSTIRQANGSASARVRVVIGVQERTTRVRYAVGSRCTIDNITFGVGIGYDSTTAFATGSLSDQREVFTTGRRESLIASYTHQTPVGLHAYNALEHAQTTNTVTFYGDNGGTVQHGISGEFWG